MGKGLFDYIALISVIIVFAPVFIEIGSTEVELFALNELICSTDFRFAVAERGKDFSPVVSREVYSTFVLVRDSSLGLFAEKSLQRIN